MLYSKRKGFTLVEILVVIGIISLIMTIILVGVSETRAKARDAKRWAEIKQLEKAIEVYGAMYGEWPGLGDSGGAHISDQCDSDLKDDLTEAGLLGGIPTDPTESPCNKNKDTSFFYGWDAAHCCGSCLAPGSTTCQICISINRFESSYYRDHYSHQDVDEGGNANMDGADYNRCFDTDTQYGN